MKKLLNAGLFFSFALFCSSQAWAGLIAFNVGVNTSAVAGQSGFVDFTFLSGSAAAPAATATVTNFTRVGGSLGAAVLSGNATGALPGVLTLGNAGGFNDIFQAVTFGTQYAFQASVNTPAPNGSNVGSRLSVSLYAADGVTPLLTVDPGGNLYGFPVQCSGRRARGHGDSDSRAAGWAPLCKWHCISWVLYAIRLQIGGVILLASAGRWDDAVHPKILDYLSVVI